MEDSNFLCAMVICDDGLPLARAVCVDRFVLFYTNDHKMEHSKQN